MLLVILLGAYLAWANIEQVTRVHGSWVTDFHDTTRLVGYAEAVFVGRVVEQVQEIDDKPLPHTQFKVQVLQPIKATRKVNPRSIESEQVPNPLADIVVVDQYGGHIRDNTGKRTLVLVDDQPLLVPGQTYLLATAYDQDQDWYHVLPVGAISIDDAGELVAVVDKFKKAKNKQVLFKLDNKGVDTADPAP